MTENSPNLPIPSPQKLPWRPVKRGRKKIVKKTDDVTGALVYELAKAGLTWPQIAAHTGFSEDTLQRRYIDEHRRGKAEGVAEISRHAYERAKQSDKVLLPWLRVHAGWVDKQPDDNKQIEITIKRPGE